MELKVIHADLSSFGGPSRPLRPSRVAKLVSCGMQVVLDQHSEEAGGKAAQTGNLVHDAAEWYHKTTGAQEARVAAGLAALEAARVQFPDGDNEKARKIFGQYTQDKKNQDAEVVWCEQQVTLTLAPAPGDPTGEPIIIRGTLDQIRLLNDLYTVWDIKTGEYYTAPDSVTEYAIQQAVYTLAARETLDARITPGGLIYTPSYSKRGNPSAHIPLGLTVDQCWAIVSVVPAIVAEIRRGRPPTRPSVDGCKFCPFKTFPNCLKTFKGIY